MSECVALIVSAGSPPGQQIARQLAANSFRIALNDLLPDRIEQLASELGVEAAAYAADLSRKLSLQTMLQGILEKWGRIDALIFVAGIQPSDAILDMDEWDWHRALDLNLTAAFLCMQSVGRVMREIGGGAIINVLAGDSSVGSAVYKAAAAGLLALSDFARAEFAGHNIHLYTLKAEVDTPAKITELCKSLSSFPITTIK